MRVQVLERRYGGPPGRQVHWLMGGMERTGRPPLCCLHATAYAGRSMAPFLERMAELRPVAAPDTPGYGGSDAPDRRLTLEGYGEVVAQAIDEALGGPVDLFGYHTGALIAAEIARRRPALVRRLVLIGVPFFEGDEQRRWRERLSKPRPLEACLDQFAERWDYLVASRPPGMTLRRGFDNFVDELRAVPDEWQAHDAAFRFDAAACFAAINQPVLILNPATPLAEASRRTAAALAHATLVELPEVRHAPFDLVPEELARRMDAFLSSP